MALPEPHAAAGEATAPVPVLERPPQRRRDRARPDADLQQPPVLVVAHHHAARVAGQALRRFRGNAAPVLEDRLARMLGVGQHRGVDVDHDLVALAGSPGIEPVVQRGLGQQGQGVGLLLRHRGGLSGTAADVPRGSESGSPASAGAGGPARIACLLAPGRW